MTPAKAIKLMRLKNVGHNDPHINVTAAVRFLGEIILKFEPDLGPIPLARASFDEAKCCSMRPCFVALALLTERRLI